MKRMSARAFGRSWRRDEQHDDGDARIGNSRVSENIPALRSHGAGRASVSWEHLKLAFYPKGSLIVSPQTGVVRVFRILQRGKVVVRHAGDANVMEHSMLTLGPGEGFSIGSVAGQRPSTSFYMAISDVFAMSCRLRISLR